jgi:hypothetical protein
MALTTLTVRVDQEELDFLDRLALQHEGILSKQGVVRLLLQHAQAAGWDPLDRPLTLGEPSTKGEGSTSKAVNSKAVSTRSTKKTAYIEIGDRIAPELSFCRLDLIDWWALRRAQYGKQAVGTEQAWTASQNALLAILRVHGAQVVTDTVQAGLANAWRGFRESYAVLPKPATPAQGKKTIDWSAVDDHSFFK